MVVNSGRPIGVVQEGSSNSDHEQCRQTVTMNSGRQTVVVNSVVQEGSSKRGRQTVVMNSGREQWSSNRGRPRGVVKQ